MQFFGGGGGGGLDDLFGGGGGMHFGGGGGGFPGVPFRGATSLELNILTSFGYLRCQPFRVAALKTFSAAQGLRPATDDLQVAARLNGSLLLGGGGTAPTLTWVILQAWAALVVTASQACAVCWQSLPMQHAVVNMTAE